MTKSEIGLACARHIATMTKNYHARLHEPFTGFLQCEEDYCTEARRVMREIGIISEIYSKAP